MTKIVRRSLLPALAAGAVLAAPAAQADRLVYEPINPAFGGNAFNGDFLLSTANIQNQFVEQREELTPEQEFAERLESRLLSQLSIEITQAIFGDDVIDDTAFAVGDINVVVRTDGDNAIITITDIVTGGVSEIIVPTGPGG